MEVISFNLERANLLRISPRDVDAFRVRWRVRGAVEYAQITPFFEDETFLATAPYAYWASPFYDPFFYGPFAWSSLTPGVGAPLF